MPDSDLKFIQGARLYLRPLSSADAEGAYPSWLNQASVCFGNSHHIYPYTREMAREYIANASKGHDHLILAIVLNDSHQHIGNIALQGIHPVYRSAELSILIGAQNCWGQGYGKEAIALLLAHGFNNLNLNRITCGTFSNNVAMQGIARSLGMREEGLRRQAIYKEGKYLDVLEYGILAEDFYAS